MKYTYPAIFTQESNNQYSVVFPDFEGSGYACITGGDDLNDSIAMAQDALNLTLYTMEQDKATVPISSDIKTIVVADNEFVTLVACDTNEYKKFFETKAVKKTLTIPSWLNAKAEKQGVNFSQILQDALINYVGQ